MQNCQRCNSERLPEDIYCGMCGYKLDSHDRMSHITQKELTVEDVRVKLGMVYYRMEKYHEAIDIFDKTLKINPDDPVAKRMLEAIKEKLFDGVEE
ncbi:MAG: tetratricopeptide repeat protein [Calditrichaceae bacterium]|jgi:tetratricopeptide (TPR) repeat protein